MDFGKVLTRAWQITWRWKALWILGFLASLGQGWNPSSSVNYTTDGKDWGSQGMQLSDRIPGEIWAIIGVVSCLAILLGIALWVLSIIGRGGLVAGVQQVEQEGSTSLGQAWRVGVKRFWTLFGLNILTSLPVLILVIAGLVLMGFLVFGTIAAIDSAAEVGGVLGGSALLLCGGTLCCGTLLLGIVLEQIRVYGERAAILEGLNWIDSFKRGWQVIREHLGPTVLLWLIFLVLGLVLAAVIFGGLAAVVLPFVAVFHNVDVGSWIVVPICLGGLLGIILSALIGSIVTTFTSATWTLAYRELTGIAVPVVVEAPGEE